MFVKILMLATAADIVAGPSAPAAFVEGIMEVPKNGFGITELYRTTFG